MSQASEQAAKQAQTNYLNYKKIKGFEDVGYFLENYVVSGGLVTQNITRNDEVDVSEIVTVLDNDVTRRDGTTFQTKQASSTYFLDFKDGDFTWGLSHPSGIAKTDYLTIAEVTTDANGNVDVITDKRGVVGGFRLKPGYEYPEISALQEDVAQLNGSNMREVITAYTGDELTTVNELDGDGTTITETTITYHPDGRVNTITENIGGNLYLSTLNYIDGELDRENPVTRSVI